MGPGLVSEGVVMAWEGFPGVLGVNPGKWLKEIQLPMQEMEVQSLDREDPLEKEMATRSSIIAWEIHGQRSLVGSSPWGRKESDMTEHLNNNNKWPGSVPKAQPSSPVLRALGTHHALRRGAKDLSTLKHKSSGR